MGDVGTTVASGTIPRIEDVEARVPDELEAYEIVDGQVLLTVGATYAHQECMGLLHVELSVWARPRGAVVLLQPFNVPTTPTRRRQPDLLVVLAEHRHRVAREGLRGAPDLVIEVLSDSTRRTDLVEKRAEYAALGVGEYVCVDPDAGEAFAAAPPDAPWRRISRGELLSSVVLPDFEIPLDRVLPPPDPQ
jgi:Uma2 family endonuclease